MKRLFVISILLLIVFFQAGASFADTDSQWKLYNAESKNPWLAVGAAWLVPTLGHAYAGDWMRGLPFLGAEAAGIALMMSGDGSGSTIGLGAGVLLVARIWEYIDAYQTAEKTNGELKKQYGLSLGIRNDLPVLAFNYNF